MRQATRLVEILRARRIPLIINDRADIARAAGAEGVHLGRSDLPIEAARVVMGTGRIIGVSVRLMSEALSAERAGADYLGVGPVFATRSKDDAGEPLGLSGLSRVSRAVCLPILAIGGIDAANAASVIGRGADGVAVISAIASAEDPECETAKIIESIGRRGDIRRRPLRARRPGGRP